MYLHHFLCLGASLLPCLAAQASSIPSLPSASAPVTLPIPIPSSSGTKPLVVGYWSNWRHSVLPIEEIPFKDLDILHYFVATVNLDGTLVSDRPEEITPFSAAAHTANPNIKVSLSLFGWSGSVNASSVLKDPATRKVLVDGLVKIVTESNLQIVEVDYEYPGPNPNVGAPCNTRDASDVANLQTFCEELKKAMPSLLLMAAVSAAGPFYISATEQSTDVSAFAPLFDYILIMTYDVFGTFSKTSGPNSPLSKKDCSPEAATAIGNLDVESSVASWVAAGYPARQLLIGAASYGHSFLVTADAASPNLFLPHTGSGPGDNITQPLGEKQLGDLCPGTVPTDTGTFVYRTLAEYSTSAEWTTHFDDCSQTPFLVSKAGDKLISYDDPRSVCEKMQFVKTAGLAGVSIFDLAGLDKEGQFMAAIKSDTTDCKGIASAQQDGGESLSESGSPSASLSENASKTSTAEGETESGIDSNNESEGQGDLAMEGAATILAQPLILAGFILAALMFRH